MLLDAVEEMRDAGAEVIEVNDSVRVVASTWFGTDGRAWSSTASRSAGRSRIEVIGDPHSLEEAARFRGGMVSEITGPRIGGQVQIDQQIQRLEIESLHAAPDESVRSPRVASAQPRADRRRSLTPLQEHAVSDYPEDLKYTSEHEWVRSGNGSTVRVGITEYAAEQLGDIVFVVAAVGRRDGVRRGRVRRAGVDQERVRHLHARSPGWSRGQRHCWSANPETINADPYGDGWLFELELDDGADLDDLLDADAYAEQVGSLSRGRLRGCSVDRGLNSPSHLEPSGGLE